MTEKEYSSLKINYYALDSISKRKELLDKIDVVLNDYYNRCLDINKKHECNLMIPDGYQGYIKECAFLRVDRREEKPLRDNTIKCIVDNSDNNRIELSIQNFIGDIDKILIKRCYRQKIGLKEYDIHNIKEQVKYYENTLKDIRNNLKLMKEKLNKNEKELEVIKKEYEKQKRKFN